MANSRKPGPLNPPAGMRGMPAKAPLGSKGGADPNLIRPPATLPQGASGFAADSAPLAPAATLSMSAKAIALLQAVESLRLAPYDDQTGKDTAAWVPGATIGYGHLIEQADWDTYKDGITVTQANDIFDTDALPFVKLVRAAIKADLAQNQFDALVILAFNIGPHFTTSSVVELINNPNATTEFSSLELAWKAWNKSQGKVMEGLDNRRQCEWNIYSLGVYERW